MAASTLNFNVGVLGHIDSGKTSLAKALSTVASTASFDKNPQSKERGITLDLGFSSFCVDVPDHIKSAGAWDRLQFTLVDCPGHASLIRTIIGGAQIIDLMMLVIDVTKGVQTQTAECLVIGEITCGKMIVVLNKVDLLPEAEKANKIERMKKRIHKMLETTRFAGCQVVPVAAKPGGPEAGDVNADGVDTLIDTLKSLCYVPDRDPSGPLIFAVDHCFSIRGQGTVMTGTMLSGSININDTIEIPSMKVTKKVKSMQMFKVPVDKAQQGDRAGICVTQFDPKQLERGVVCTPGALPTISAALLSVKKIPYFKGTINTKAKFHITLGHETIMGKATFFGLYEGVHKSSQDPPTAAAGVAAGNLPGFDFDKEYFYQESLIPVDEGKQKGASMENAEELPSEQFALLELERPVPCGKNALVIGSKLDTDIHANICRLAFYGRVMEQITDAKYQESVLPRVKVYKNKAREGVVERKVDEHAVICRGLFKKETNMDAFVNLKVHLSTGEKGTIEGSFGQSGKFKVRIPDGLSEKASQLLAAKGGKKGKGKGGAAAEAPSESTPSETITLTLAFKKYIFDPKKRMIQT